MKRHPFHFKTDEELLTKTVTEWSEELGKSIPSIREFLKSTKRKCKAANKKRKIRNLSSSTRKQILELGKEKVKTMTILELASYCDRIEQSIRQVLNKLGWKYKKKKRGRPSVFSVLANIQQGDKKLTNQRLPCLPTIGCYLRVEKVEGFVKSIIIDTNINDITIIV